MSNKTFYSFVLVFFTAVFVWSLLDSVGTISRPKAHDFDEFVGKESLFKGVVCAELEARDTTLKFCFAPYETTDRILVTAPRYPEYSYGDELSLTGKLEFPENFSSYGGGPEFNYVAYLNKDGIRYLLNRPKIESTGINKGNRIKILLFKLKSLFTGTMKDSFPEPEVSLLAGVLLGEKSGLSKELTDQFRNAGLVHILVLSGSNVTIVADGLMKMFSFLPLFLSRIFGAFSIILFALMTGASATTVRATIMALIVILVTSSARRYNVTRALIIAAFFMTLENPHILAFDASFQLSFLATLALIYVTPVVSEKISWVTNRFKLREMVATTIGTQILTTPLILHMSGQLSVVSLVPNLLVLPFVPMAMFGGFVSVLVGFIHQTIALPFAGITSIVLTYIIKITSFFGSLPFASVHIKMSTFMLIFSYICIVWYLIRFWRQKSSSQPSAS